MPSASSSRGGVVRRHKAASKKANVIVNEMRTLLLPVPSSSSSSSMPAIQLSPATTTTTNYDDHNNNSRKSSSSSLLLLRAQLHQMDVAREAYLNMLLEHLVAHAGAFRLPPLSVAREDVGRWTLLSRDPATMPPIFLEVTLAHVAVLASTDEANALRLSRIGLGEHDCRAYHYLNLTSTTTTSRLHHHHSAFRLEQVFPVAAPMLHNQVLDADTTAEDVLLALLTVAPNAFPEALQLARRHRALQRLRAEIGSIYKKNQTVGVVVLSDGPASHDRAV